ncbi:T9SS type A sorting domain-containing protein [Hymenobacter sp. BT559]|uniref:T9SS type A sorting domain-containing protein n=1 Tax=Hymenobacter sp. BT559 TaxID=2795729 RepID=UPI0018EA94EA|nr:T9SS type A sorting domain-containing protein [Hymenobacter sp. BT559]MBJ6143572.1 T9SS type A sorting domain-containing protein [Hymenobacter sp. BT559]
MRFSTTILVFLTLLTGATSWAAPHTASQPKLTSYRATQTATPTMPTLTVFPNPTRGQLTVQAVGLTGQGYKFRLANVLGREVRLLAFRPEQASEALAVDLTGLPAGLYFYSLLVNDKIVSTKRLTLQAD